VGGVKGRGRGGEGIGEEWKGDAGGGVGCNKEERERIERGEKKRKERKAEKVSKNV
jgi:hypothetical protein